MSATDTITKYATAENATPLRLLPQYQLVKAAADGRTVTLGLILEHRVANRRRLAALRSKMLQATVAVANSVLKNANRDRDALASLRAEIALVEDADRALELAEVLSRLSEIEAEQKQRNVERERLARERDKVQAEYDLEDRPSYSVERQERLVFLQSQIHGIAAQITDVDQQIECARRQTAELEDRLQNFAVSAHLGEDL